MNESMMGVYKLADKECGMTILLNCMDISNLMEYSQQMEESKNRDIRQAGKRPRLDESSRQKPKKRPRSDDSSHQEPKKRFFPQDSSIGNKDRDLNKLSQGGGHTFERTRCTSCGKKHLGNRLARTDGYVVCGNRVRRVRDFPNINDKGK